MSRLWLVRHGEAAAGWADDLDPGLSEEGRAQAEAMADDLAGRLAPSPILASPLRRTVETAAPLTARWGTEPVVEPAVGEVSSPTRSLEERAAWLRTVMAGSWADQAPQLRSWRDDVVGTLLAVEQDSVVVSHFVAINAAVGAALHDDRVVVFRPGYCSVTQLDNGGGRLALVELGGEALTAVR